MKRSSWLVAYLSIPRSPSVRSSSASSSSTSSSSSEASLVDFRDRSPLMSGSSEISPLVSHGGAARSSPLNLSSIAPEVSPVVRQRRFLSFAVENNFEFADASNSSSSTRVQTISTAAAASAAASTSTAFSTMPSPPRYGSSRASGSVADLSDDDEDADVNTEMLERYLRPPIPSSRHSSRRTASMDNEDGDTETRSIADPAISESPASPASSTQSTIGTRSSMDDPTPMEASGMASAPAVVSNVSSRAASSMGSVSNDAIPLMPEIVVIPETGSRIARSGSLGDDDDDEVNNMEDEDDVDVGHDSSATETASNSESNDQWERPLAAQVFLSSSSLSSLPGPSSLSQSASRLFYYLWLNLDLFISTDPPEIE